MFKDGQNWVLIGTVVGYGWSCTHGQYKHNGNGGDGREDLGKNREALWNKVSAHIPWIKCITEGNDSTTCGGGNIK